MMYITFVAFVCSFDAYLAKCWADCEAYYAALHQAAEDLFGPGGWDIYAHTYEANDHLFDVHAALLNRE